MTFLLQTADGPMSVVAAARHNLAPATTVALVSLSLSISLGIASGATPVMVIFRAVYYGAQL